MARNRGAAVAAPAGGDSVATQRMRIPTNGPHDGDTLAPEITPAPGTVDFGAVRVPVPAGGTVSVEPTTAGRIQAVHVTVPEGRLSVSALAAPRNGRAVARPRHRDRRVAARGRGAGAVVHGGVGPGAARDHRRGHLGVRRGRRAALDAVRRRHRPDAGRGEPRRAAAADVAGHGRGPRARRRTRSARCLPLVTPSESGGRGAGGRVRPAHDDPARARRRGDRPTRRGAHDASGRNAAVPFSGPLAASVNGATPVNGSTNGAVNGAAVQRRRCERCRSERCRADDDRGVPQERCLADGARRRLETGATRKDVPATRPSTTGGSRTGPRGPAPFPRASAGRPSPRRRRPRSTAVGRARQQPPACPFPGRRPRTARAPGPVPPVPPARRPGPAGTGQAALRARTTGVIPARPRWVLLRLCTARRGYGRRGHTGATPLGPLRL